MMWEALELLLAAGLGSLIWAGLRLHLSLLDENVEDVRITFTRVKPAMLAEIVAHLKRWPGTLDVPRA